MPLKGADNLNFALDELIDKSEENIKAAVFTMFSGIIEGTPVDTGRARGNWFLTQGAPSNKTVKGTRRNSLSQLSKLDEKRTLDKTWYLTNNLPYVEGLEYEGKSRQAPLGWVRRTIKRTRIAIKRGRL